MPTDPATVPADAAERAFERLTMDYTVLILDRPSGSETVSGPKGIRPVRPSDEAETFGEAVARNRASAFFRTVAKTRSLLAAPPVTRQALHVIGGGDA